jgi:lysophospholipase L1-like esterase
MRTKRERAFSILAAVLYLAVALGIAEAVLRVKHSSMQNYDIEMWRYAKELKVKSADQALDFDHDRSKAAILQNVEIRLNEWGLRGGPVAPLAAGQRRMLVLGGSITLGWGVPEDETLEARLQSGLGADAQVLNGGIGNYNTERYVSRFFKNLVDLKPTDIVVQYFLRDAEYLPPSDGNFVLRHSHLAVTLWIAAHRLFDKQGEQTLVDHYRQVYSPEAHGFTIMKRQLARLAAHAKEHGIRLYLAMTPDVHNLVDYKLGFVHDIMRGIAQEDGYAYIDLLPAMLGRPPQEIWAMPGDPHPNALGHRLMADAILAAVAKTGQAQSKTN